MLAEIAEEQGFSATYDNIAELAEDGNYSCLLIHALIMHFGQKFTHVPLFSGML